LYKSQNFNLDRTKNVLFCVLNWGLGHASRSIPLIQQEIKKGNKLFVAGSGLSLTFLKAELSAAVTFIELPDYAVRYTTSKFFSLKLILQIPKILNAILKEHKQVKKIVKNYKIDEIISDNRYGCYNKNVHSKFITHQLYIKLPKQLKYLEKFLSKVNFYFINRFDVCYIIDEEQSLLSGALSNFKEKRNKPKCDIEYIGAISRLKKDIFIKKEKGVLIILSGPEPQRTQLEDEIRLKYKNENKSFEVLLIRGTNLHPNAPFPIKFKTIDLAKTKEVNNALNAYDKIVCRSGYSTILDLHKLEKKAILIPTPNQTEQEYLAKHLTKNFGFKTISQKDFSFNFMNFD